MMTLKKERVASVKDATRLRSKSNYNKIGFNPRTRKGCDPKILPAFNPRKVSIHAPVKDATISFISQQNLITFQSTHP